MTQEKNKLSPSNLVTILIFLFGLLISSGSTYAMMSSRVAVLETEVKTLHVSAQDNSSKIAAVSSDISQIKTDVALIRQKLFEVR